MIFQSNRRASKLIDLPFISPKRRLSSNMDLIKRTVINLSPKLDKPEPKRLSDSPAKKTTQK